MIARGEEDATMKGARFAGIVGVVVSLVSSSALAAPETHDGFFFRGGFNIGAGAD